MLEITSNKELFEKLCQLEKLKGKINFNNDIIQIIFHNDLQLSIIFNKCFNVYINDIFYYNIEGQDIFGCIEEIANDIYVICKIKKWNKTIIKLVSQIGFIDSPKFASAWTVNEKIK